MTPPQENSQPSITKILHDGPHLAGIPNISARELKICLEDIQMIPALTGKHHQQLPTFLFNTHANTQQQ